MQPERAAGSALLRITPVGKGDRPHAEMPPRRSFYGAKAKIDD